MRYQLKNLNEAHEAFEYLNTLVAGENIVDIKKVSPKRTLSQNNYYHLLLGIFGLESGYTIEEAKTLHKREVCPDIFVYEKNDKKFLKSSADLTTEEMSKSIDKFKLYAGEQGIELPEATNEEQMIYYQNLIEKNNVYL